MNNISGQEISQQVLSQLRSRPKPPKSLSVVVVGMDPATRSFIAQKKKATESLNISFDLFDLPSSASPQDLENKIHLLAQDSHIGGVVLQLPLPGSFPTQQILSQIPPEKDVDLISEKATTLLQAGQSKILPPTVGVVEEILRSQSYNLDEKTVAIVGLGRLVGRPIANWINGKAKKLILIDRGDNIEQIGQADLVISGAGQPQLINPESLKEGAAVIDFGYGKINNQTSGDLDTLSSGALEKLSFYTPTPGGTGPILVAKLLENFYNLNQ